MMADSGRGSDAEIAHRDQIDEEGARGAITIAPNVLLELMELTIAGVDGIAGTAAPAKASGRVAALPGKGYTRGGVVVHLDEQRIHANVGLLLVQSASVADVVPAVRTQVALAVERTLGMSVAEINIDIVDIAPIVTKKDLRAG